MPNTPEIGVAFGVEGNQILLQAITQLREGLKDVKREQDNTRSSALTLANAWGSMVTAASALHLAAFARDAVESAVSIGRLSAATGLSTQTLSVYRKAVHDAGLNQEMADASIKRLAKSMLQLEQGNKKTAATFAMLRDESGKPLTTQSFKGLDDNQKFRKVIDALGRTKGSLEAMGAAQQLLGKSSGELLAVLQRLSGEGFDELERQTKLLGLEVTPQMVAQIARAHEAMAELGDTAHGMATQFVTGLAPAMTDVGQALVVNIDGKGVNAFKKLGEWAGLVLKGIVQGFVNLGIFAGATAAHVEEVFGYSWDAIKSGGVTVFQALAQAAEGNISQALATLKRGFSQQLDLAKDHDSRLRAIWKSAGDAEQQAYTNIYYGGGNPKLPPKPGQDLDRGAGAGAGKTKDEFRTDRAELEAKKASAQQELEIQRAFDREQAEQDKDDYEHGLISLDEYFNRRAEIVRAGRAREMQVLGDEKHALQEMLAKAESTRVAPGDKSGEAAKQQTILDIKKQIGAVESQMVLASARSREELSKLDGDRFNAAIEHKQKELELEKKLAEAQGDRIKAAKLAGEIEDLQTRRELEQLGRSKAEIDALLAKLDSARDTRAAGETAKTGFEEKYAGFERRKAAIQERASGPDAEPAYKIERELAALYRSEIPALQEKVNLLRQAADAARAHKGEDGKPDQLGLAGDLDKQADEKETQVVKLQADLTKMDVSWMQWKTRAKESIDQVSQEMATGLNGWIEGHQKFGQAVAKTWNQMVMTGIQGAEKLAAHFIAMELKKLLFKRASDAAQTASTAQNAAQGTAIEKTHGLKSILIAAKVAAVNAFKAVMAHVPFPFNIVLAPAAAAGVFAGAMAYAAFESGGVVDKDKHAPAFAGRSFTGMVSGPGGIDKVPAYLTHGESVLTTRATSALGKGTIDAINRGDFGALNQSAFRGANLPALRQAAPYTAAGLSRIAGGAGAFKAQPASGPVSFSHTTHIDGLQALDGASVRAALQEHGDLISEMAVGAVKGYIRQGGVNR